MIVLTLTGDRPTLERGLGTADPRADVVELRLDRVAGCEIERLAGAARAAGRPWIATCRRAGEGGAFRGVEADRVALLRAAGTAGAWRVDLEAGTGALALLAELPPARRIVSRHDPDLPADAAARLAALREAAGPGGWAKYVPTARRAGDVAPVRDLLVSAGEGVVVFASGAPGRATRALARAWGSVATYAVPDGEPSVGAGQPTISGLLDEWDERALGAASGLTAIGGRPVGESLSPAMHNRVLRESGRSERMVPLEAADADDLLGAAGALGLSGLAVTRPFKPDVARRCADLDPAARRIGSVNTLLRTSDGWDGRSTDGEGFLEGFPVLPPEPTVAVLGSGGAAAAVAAALAARGARVTIHARRAGSAEELAARLGVRAAPWGGAPGAGTDLLVNATPVGQDDPDALPLPAECLDRARAVVDIVYGPRPTRLVREARRRGRVAVDGLPMLVGQARLQMRLLYGVEPSVASLRDVCRTTLAVRGGGGGAGSRERL